MAGPQRRFAHTLAARIQAQPHRFDFFQLVRVLTWMRNGQRGGSAVPSIWSLLASVLGGELDPAQEAVRFRNAPGLVFPWAAALPRAYGVLGQAAAPDTAAQTEIVAALMGLVGASGVLPEHYTETLYELARDKEAAVGKVAEERESALQAFLDSLSHRSVSFYYRAWAKYRLPINWEQARRLVGKEADPVTVALRSLVGLGTPRLIERLGLHENFPVYFGGYFARKLRPAAALRQVLRHRLGMEVEIEEFHGRWLLLDRSQQTRLRIGPGTLGQHACLGCDAIAGDKIWDISGNFRIRVGPVDAVQFEALMPECAWLQEINHLVRLFVGPQLAFDIQVLLKADAVPQARLQRCGTPLRLRRNAWIRRQPVKHDADNAVFRCA